MKKSENQKDNQNKKPEVSVKLMAKCNLGKVKAGQCRSAVASRHGSGATFKLTAGGAHGLHHISLLAGL